MSDWHAARRLLVACLGRRDCVHDLLPALHRLRAALPHARLSWLGLARALPVTSAFPAFDSILVYPHLGAAAGRHPGPEPSFVDRIRRANFDAVIIFTPAGESPSLVAYACYLAGIPLRAGQSAEFGGGVLSHAFEPPPPGEDRHLALLDALGLETSDEKPEHIRSISDP